MPTTSPPATILVTGANGYLGLWIVRALLERGYLVRGTVRTSAAAQTVLDTIQQRHPAHVKNIECILVPDITIVGAFNEAVRGVSGVIHTASPMTFGIEDPEEYFKPAIGGTVGILKSVREHGEDVKRVVITSSIAAIVGTAGPPGVYSEDTWNEVAVRVVEEQGKAAPGEIKYLASKVHSERAAWKFYHEHKSELPWELCTILPSWTIGPPPSELPSPAAMGSTPGYMYSQLFSVPPPPQRQPPCFNYVDVHDVVELHVRALEVEAAGGERIIASSHVCSWQDWLNAANDLAVLPGLDKGNLAAAKSYPPHPECSNEKAKRIFGYTFKTVPETLREVYADFSARGWLRHLEG
ncbi:NAD-P-binding protein [Trametes elegans]|nr:NAD-P-binding protein [Trametes elegans]